MKETFRKFSARIAAAVGSPLAFLTALIVVVIWASTGSFFNYSDTWQLVINTGTTIITFLMVFVIQNTQNREGKAMQLKLDELIRSQKGARHAFVELEDLKDEELAALGEEFKHIHTRYSSKLTSLLQEQIQAEKERRHHRSLLDNFGDAINRATHPGKKD
ncbi:low affinity iron permease family protein [Candidatus Saccharibacteria bacterium]|nr:low affinity iron permease family protein [Candidatus Saccharibacteria bacterium]MCB9821452.1 low affinity iron permease family protein [Candidatus Nomurabacteria bacterium]